MPPESGLAPVTVNVHFVRSEAKTRELAEVKKNLANGYPLHAPTTRPPETMEL